MEKPTRRQVEFAQELQLDVPEGITREGLRRLISGALEAKHRDRQENQGLPNEIVSAVRIPSGHSSYMRKMEVVRRKKLRRGDVVRNSSGGATLVVLGHHPTNIVYIRTITLANHNLRMVNGTLLSRIYESPETHLHELAILPWVFVDAKDAPALKQRMLAFRDFAMQRLSAEHRISTEYGDFWQISAVETLLGEFDLDQAHS